MGLPGVDIGDARRASLLQRLHVADIRRGEVVGFVHQRNGWGERSRAVVRGFDLRRIVVVLREVVVAHAGQYRKTWRELDCVAQVDRFLLNPVVAVRDVVLAHARLLGQRHRVIQIAGAHGDAIAAKTVVEFAHLRQVADAGNDIVLDRTRLELALHHCVVRLVVVGGLPAVVGVREIPGTVGDVQEAVGVKPVLPRKSILEAGLPGIVDAVVHAGAYGKCVGFVRRPWLCQIPGHAAGGRDGQVRRERQAEDRALRLALPVHDVGIPCEVRGDAEIRGQREDLAPHMHVWLVGVAILVDRIDPIAEAIIHAEAAAEVDFLAPDAVGLIADRDFSQRLVRRTFHHIVDDAAGRAEAVHEA